MMVLITVLSWINTTQVDESVRSFGNGITSDIGEDKSIHPAEKIKFGERLSYWTLGKDYNIKGIQFSWPFYKSHQVDWEKQTINN